MNLEICTCFDPQHSSYYGHLPSEERSTYNGLLHATERKHLKQYIDSVGYGAVFGLLESEWCPPAHRSALVHVADCLYFCLCVSIKLLRYGICARSRLFKPRVGRLL